MREQEQIQVMRRESMEENEEEWSEWGREKESKSEGGIGQIIPRTLE